MLIENGRNVIYGRESPKSGNGVIAKAQKLMELRRTAKELQIEIDIWYNICNKTIGGGN